MSVHFVNPIRLLELPSSPPQIFIAVSNTPSPITSRSGRKLGMFSGGGSSVSGISPDMGDALRLCYLWTRFPATSNQFKHLRKFYKVADGLFYHFQVLFDNLIIGASRKQTKVFLLDHRSEPHRSKAGLWRFEAFWGIFCYWMSQIDSELRNRR